MAGYRLQSSMEYITTYGWALVVIAIVGAALFYLHVFNPATSTTCVLPAGLSCTNLYMSQNGLLSFTILQTTGSTVNVTAAGCNSNTTVSNTIMEKPYNPPSNQVTVDIGSNYTMAVQCYSAGHAFSGKVGSGFLGYLIINYTDQNSNLPHTVFGNINVQVS